MTTLHEAMIREVGGPNLGKNTLKHNWTGKRLALDQSEYLFLPLWGL